MLANTLRQTLSSPGRTVGRPQAGGWRLALLALGCSLVLGLGAGDALAGQLPVPLGAASSYAVLPGSTVTIIPIRYADPQRAARAKQQASAATPEGRAELRERRRLASRHRRQHRRGRKQKWR